MGDVKKIAFFYIWKVQKRYLMQCGKETIIVTRKGSSPTSGWGGGGGRIDASGSSVLLKESISHRLDDCTYQIRRVHRMHHVSSYTDAGRSSFRSRNENDIRQQASLVETRLELHSSSLSPLCKFPPTTLPRAFSTPSISRWL